MPEYLSIKARLPQAAGLELSARLLAARPHWDIELEGDELRLSIDLIRGQVDGELGVLEEACRQVERHKNIELSDFWLSRESDAPNFAIPPSAGPWRLSGLKDGEEAPAPRPDRLALPPESPASARFWAGEGLALSLVAEHLTPPPGAPETRGQAFLALGHLRPLAPVAALLAGAAEAFLLSDEAACAFTQKTAALNGNLSLTAVSQPFNIAARNQGDWAGRFALITLHLSPYLATRRLKTLVSWLAADGAIIISGFAPGPQTAHLLRAAAKAGLFLSSSVIFGDWAAMKLEPVLFREELPPLTGSVVPALVDLPPEEIQAQEEEIPDVESLMLDEEETEDDSQEA